MSENSGLIVVERPTCATCVFFEDGDVCSRFPPDADGHYADTNAIGGCGEHPDFPAYLASVTLPKAQVDDVGGVVIVATPIKPFGKGINLTRSGDKWAVEFYGLEVDSFSPLGLHGLPEKVEELVRTWGQAQTSHANEVDPVEYYTRRYDRLAGATRVLLTRTRTVTGPRAQKAIDDVKAALDTKLTEVPGDDLPTVAEMAAVHDAEMNAATGRLMEYVTCRTLSDIEALGASATIKSLRDDLAEKDRIIANLRSYCKDYRKMIRTKEVTVVEQAEVIAKLEENKVLMGEMGWEQANLINRQAKSMEEMRGTIDALCKQAKEQSEVIARQAKGMEGLRIANESLRGQVAVHVRSCGDLHTLADQWGESNRSLRDQVSSLRGEVTQLGELNERQERKLDEANETIVRLTNDAAWLTRVNEDWAKEVNRIDAKCDQATERYRELAKAAQSVAERSRQRARMG